MTALVDVGNKKLAITKLHVSAVFLQIAITSGGEATAKN
jgi:hypothetical protein